MRLLWMIWFLIVTVIAADEVDLEKEVLHETIAAGRGERDDIGVRDQWSSTDHLTSKFNSRQPILANVKRLLREYRLECDGCDNDEAVARINAFVRDTKRYAKRRAQYQKWLERTALSVVALGTAMFLFTKIRMSKSASGKKSAGSVHRVVDDQKRSEIEEQQRGAAMKEESVHAKRGTAPTWRDNEEKEVWTPKQEKQFAKGLVSFGGIPPKERYRLIADKVDDKTRQECLMHHKLQQLIAKEQ